MTNVYQYLFQLQNCVIMQSEKVGLKDVCITHMAAAAVSKISVTMCQAT